MSSNINTVTVEDLMQFMQAQQESFASQMAEATRRMEQSMKALPAKRRDPPTYQGKFNEDLDLWLFATEEYYGAPTDPQDDSFVPIVAGNLGPSAMNWYRAFCQHCQAHGLPRTWGLFKTEIRKRFRARDFEFDLRQRLCKLRQHGSYHDYVSEFQNILIQCMEPISPLEQRFYFQQGLRGDTCRFINEKSPGTLEEAIDWGSQFENAHFASSASEEIDRDWTKSATCHRCKEVGHIAPDCPHK